MTPADQEYPFLRGRMTQKEFFQSPVSGRTKRIPLPDRDPGQHRERLLAQLDEIAQHASERERLPEASREIIAVLPEDAAQLPADSYGDKSSDARVAAIDPETGVVIVDAAQADLRHLRSKLDQFADDEKVTEKGARRGAAAIAPIAEFRSASTDDLAGPRFRAAAPTDDEVLWFELYCRGGYREFRPGETENTRTQITTACEILESPVPIEFVAAERIVFFVRLAVARLRQLIELVDCVLELDVAPREVVDWAVMEAPELPDLTSVVIEPPSPLAPSIVLLETGISTRHPLLAAALLNPISVVPGEASPEDANGHGTQMAGVALYEDVAAILDAAGGAANHWLHSVRVLVQPGTGYAAEENRPFWPAITNDAVEQAEVSDPNDRPRVFATAITARLEDEGSTATTWSHAVDQLAYNHGIGRLICISAGNADTTDRILIEGYPQMNLQQRIQDPAFATNALTVGACTHYDTMPPHPSLAAYQPVAPAGAISPHTSCGLIGEGPIKPEIVCEGGNIVDDGTLADDGILVTLTTGRNPVTGQPSLSTINATSGATANAARLASEIQGVDPTLRPESVRGLLVHSATWTPQMRAHFPNRLERLAACGYGLPDRATALACLRERATVIVEGDLPNSVPHENDPRKKRREVRYFRLPLPEEELLQLGDAQARLRVTLSYFAEPNTFGRSIMRGMDMAWRMQGPAESPNEFFDRINKLRRDGAKRQFESKDFEWEIGPQARSRGTVQSDRWEGQASLLAGDKLLAVYPALGWWDNRKNLEQLSSKFSLIVTVEVPGADIYSYISSSLTIPTVVEIDAR